MHIPDGYLSPASAGTLYAAVLPFWFAAGRKVKSVFRNRMLPLMALMSAFCFVIQMLNIPLPGGTTGHAVGASLTALILGVWPSVIAVSIALTIQALFFGDGGITALGANCFNMAVVQVFVTYYLYRILPGKRPVAAAIAAYVGVNAAAMFTAIELGLQPLIAQKADGTPLYAPYSLSVTVPAMLIGHLIAGLAEAAVTAAGIAYVTKSAPELMSQQVVHGKLKHGWLVLALFVFLTPLGLLAPGTAWGEWSSDQLSHIGLGFVPEGLKKWEGFWTAAFHDYLIPGVGENTGYILSALIGVAIIISIFVLANFIHRRFQNRTPAHSQ
ncbi:cobalt transporter CbiM [bacterium]|nr:cobalt transporter CbiM [bacterium]